MKTNEKIWKPYEVKPFTITMKEGKKIVQRDVVRRWDVFSFIREVAANDGSVFENKMTVRGINTILDGLIQDPKASFKFDNVLVEVDEDTTAIVEVTVKFSGAAKAA